MKDQRAEGDVKKAHYVKKLTGFNGVAELYRMEPPLEGHEYVAVSAVVAFSDGPETYIFPASEDGEVTSWGELAGSFKGAFDHHQALRNAGYEPTQ